MNDIKSILLRDEGLVLRPYKDQNGHLTIGIGRNLDAKGISKDEAFMMLDNDINEATAHASEFPWFHLLSDNRKAVIVCMIFNLGMEKFQAFRRMIAALAVGDNELAAQEMMDSTWAHQVGERAERLKKMMQEG